MNDAPVAVADTTVTTNEDTPSAAINVLGNDSDADGDTLTVTTATATNGTVAINADGTLVYTPNANYNGADTITYTISDGNGGTATATVPVTVTAVNDAPVATAGTASGTEDALAGIAVVLAGTDVDGTIASVSVPSLPLATEGILYLADGTTAINAGQVLTATEAAGLIFKPALNFNGAVTIPFTVTDNDGATSVAANMVVTVTAVNDAPLNTVPSSDLSANVATALTLTGVSVADVDAGTGTITVTLTTDTSSSKFAATASGSASVTGSGTNTLIIEGTLSDVNAILAATTYTSLTNTAHAESITVTTSDNGNTGSGGAKGDFDSFNVNITPALLASTILEDNGNHDTYINAAETPNTVIHVLLGAGVQVGDTLFIYAHQSPTGAPSAASTLGITQANIDAGFVDYTVANVPFNTVEGGLIMGEAQLIRNGVTLSTVTTGNYIVDKFAPIVVADTAIMTEDNTTVTGDVKANDTHLDGGEVFALTGSATGTYGSIVLNSTGGYTYTRNATDLNAITANAVDTFTYTVTDLAGNSTSSTIAVNVTPVNDAPLNTTPADGTVDVYQGLPTAISGLSVEDVDAGAGSITVTLSNTSGSTFSATASGGAAVSGTTTLTIVGTLADVNATLATVMYTAQSNTGTETITMLTNDGGNTGSGGSLTDSVLFTVVCNPAAVTVVITDDETKAVSNIADGTTTFTFTFNGDVSTSFAIGDISIVGGTAAGALTQVSPNVYTLAVTPDTDTQTGTMSVSVNANSTYFTSAPLVTGPSTTVTHTQDYDTLLPTVAVAITEDTISNSGTATVTFTLSEASTDFDSLDVTTTNGTLSNWSGSGTTYTATLTPSITASSFTAGDTITTSVHVNSATFSDSVGNFNADGADANNTDTMTVYGDINAVMNLTGTALTTYQVGGFAGTAENAGYVTTSTTSDFILYGNAGNDTLTGSDPVGGDSLFGGAGNDIIDGRGGADILNGGDGNDTIEGGNGNDTIYGGNGNDLITDSGTGVNLNDVIFGDNGDDTIKLTGGGSDTVYGGAGNDIVYDEGIAGAEYFVGGTGIDTMDYSFTTADITYASDTVNSLIKVTGGVQNDSLVVDGTNNFEVFVLGTGNDTISGYTAVSETIYANAGNDSVTANGSTLNADYYDGGAGIDTINMSSSGSNLYIDMPSGMTSVVSGATGTASDAFVNFEYIIGGSGNDTVIGTTGNDSLRMGTGNDSYAPGLGNDSVYENPGEGTDTLDYSAVAGAVTVAAFIGVGSTDGSFTVAGAAGNDMIDNLTGSNIGQIMEVFKLTEYNDRFVGTGYAETVLAGSGDDTIQTGSFDGITQSFNDSIDGGAGNDWLDYTYTAQFVTVDMVNGNALVNAQSNEVSTGGTAAIDRFVNIENIRTGAAADSIVGNSGANIIDAGNGNNTVNGGDGNNTILAGTGNDIIVAGINDDIINASNGTNTISSGAGNDSINLVVGADTINAGLGIDTVDYSTSLFARTFTVSGVNILVTGDGNTDSILMDGINNVEVFNMTSLNDVFNGTAYAETIYAGAGNDTIKGSTGAATDSNYIDGQAGTDWVNYSAASTGLNITMGTAAPTTVAVGSAVDTLVNVENITATNFNDTITAATTGSVMKGLNGNDLYFAGAGNDTIIEENSGGVDTINYSSTTGNLVVQAWASGGSGAIWGTNDGAFTISGGSGTDQIYRDTTSGAGQIMEVFVLGSGNDSMIGTTYNETVYGGAGNDTLSSNNYASNTSGSLSNGTRGDLLDGGAGNDWVNYSYEATSPVTINLVAATATAIFDADNVDTLVSIENVLGTQAADNITGDAGANIIDGYTGNDTINSGNGNDTVIGGLGLDAITVGSGNDVVYLADTAGSENWSVLYNTVRNSASLGGGNDTVYGSNDNDSIVAVGGSNLIYLNSGNDTVNIAGSGNNTITSTDNIEERVTTGSGNDYISLGGGDQSGTDNIVSAGDGNNTVISGNGHDSIVTGINDDSINTGIGNDTINSGSGNDTVNSGVGSNQVTLGAGNDYLVSTGGANTINAGTGIDTLDHSGDTNNFNVTTVSGALVLTNSGGWNDSVLMDGTNNVEVFMFGSGADTMRGLAIMANTSETVFMGSGNDYVFTNSTSSSTNLDYYDGGTGTDTIDFSSNTANFYVNMTSGVTSISGGGAFDTAVNFEAVVTGSGNDTIVGTSSADTMAGGTGNDYYFAGTGNERIVDKVGSGTDTVDYSSMTGGVTVTAYNGVSSADGAFTVTGSGGTDSLDGGGSGAGSQMFEAFVLTAQADKFIGTLYSETVNMGAGDDTMQTGTYANAGAFGDSINGGSGNDWIDYNYINTANMNINLVTGISSIVGAASADTLTNFENVSATVTSGSVTVTGSSADNIIYSNTGADSIIGGGGNDTINTSLGNDYISTGSGDASIIAAVNNGAQDNDTVVAAGGNNYIYTSDGNDSVIAGAGNDTIDVGTNNAAGTFSGGGTAGNDADNTNFVNAGGGNNVVIGGSGTDNITTGSGNDSINTYAGSDAVNVGTGADTVFAGANDDSIGFVGFNSTDVVDGGTGRDILYLDGSGTINLSGIPDINIESIEVIDLGGSGGSDVLTLNLADLNLFADQTVGPKYLFVRGDVGDQITGTGWGSNVSGFNVNLDMVNDGTANDNIADSNLGGIDGFANGNAGTFVTGTYVAYNVGSTWLFVENDLTRTLS